MKRGYRIRLFWLFTLFVFAQAVLAVQMASAQTIKTELLVNGLARPVFVTHAPGDNTRIFIVEQHTGRIRIYKPATGTLTTFIDIDSAADVTLVTGNESGLLGLAFDPNYQTNGRFYVNYIQNSPNRTVISRYTRTTADTASTASRVELLNYSQPRGNHNGGWIGFGPDGYLYIASGDGGSQNDPDNFAQNIDSYLGKILRIDVNGTDGSTGNYGIPASNPTAKFTKDEIWAYGLRNPWRCSFDRQTGDFYIGDVGQTLHEEVNFQFAGFAGGANYGWRLREGFVANPNSVGGSPVGGPKPADNVDPILAASRGDMRSITGGYVYRGSAIPALQGHYIYADYVSARIWTFKVNTAGTGYTDFAERTAEMVPAGGLDIKAISSFGQDADGELYVCDLTDGEVFKIISAQQAQPPVITTTPETNSFIGQNYSYDVDATGVPAPTFELVSGPAGMTIDEASGVLSWSPTIDGQFNVTVRATNSAGHVDQPFAITVASLRKPENPIVTLPDLRYFYYEQAFTVLPDFDTLTPKIISLANQIALNVRERDSNFALKFVGYVDVPADGYYTFYTRSDDGSKLYIGDQVVVDNDGQHGTQERSGVIGLEQGKHAIAVEYFQGGGGRSLEVHWEGPGLAKERIPAARWFTDPDTPLEPYLDGIFPTTVTGTMPTTLSGTGAFDDLGNLTPRFGILPYTVNSPLWSDGAVKSRWLALAHDHTVTFSEKDEWSYPAGTVFIKHFELVGSATKRLETRFLVITPTGAYGVTYRWREDGSDADLLLDSDNNGPKGLTVPVNVAGTPNTQWTFPSRASCMECHTTSADFVLGPNKTRQMNGQLTYPIVGTKNQMIEMNDRGMFNQSGDIFDPAKIDSSYDKMHKVTDVSQSLEQRVRSYLDANCANCHRPGGAPANFTAIYNVPLAESGLILGEVNADLGIPGAKVVVPKNVPLSILHHRVESVEEGILMPPIGRHLLDADAEDVIRRWIGSLSSPQVMTGSLTVSTEWQTVSLPATYEKMVVTASIENTIGNPSLVTRIRNASGNQFDIRVQRFDGQTGSVSNVTLHYLVMEEGAYSVADTGVKMEARLVNSTVTARKGSWNSQSLSYLQSYNNPVVLGQVMTFNDSRPSVFWNRGSSNGSPASSSTLYVGKHVGEDSATSRSDETLGVIILEAGSGTIKTVHGDIPYESDLGADTIRGMDTTNNYALSFSATRALVNHSAMDGGDGGWAVLKQPPSNQLALAIDEDTIGDSERSHTTEQVGYLALGEPSAKSPAKIVTGELDASTDWQTVPLPVSYSDLVVTATIVNNAPNPPLVARVRNTGSNSFEVKLQRFDGQSGSVSGIKLYWLAMEAGQFTAAQTGVKIEAQKVTSTVTDENNSWVGQPLSYLQSYTNPVILGQVMSEQDVRPSVFWSRGSSQTSPATASSLFVGKHVGEDSVIARSIETLGVVILESAVGTLKTETGDITFESALGPDTVEGVDNPGPAYPLAISATRAIVSHTAMDGGNGGWAILSQAPAGNQLSLLIDEDTLGDSERWHITEQVGYLALGQTVVAPQVQAMSQMLASIPGTFVTGINFGGGAVTIEGQQWLSHDAALSQGLTLGQHEKTSTTVIPEPLPEPDATKMLQSLIKRSQSSLEVDQTLADGNYDVYLWYMEDRSESREFDVLLEDAAKGEIGKLDQKKWQRLGPLPVTVSDGVLNVTLGTKVIGTEYSDTQIMGMAIYRR